jgi:MYXO-CTERM domain-containing protein
MTKYNTLRLTAAGALYCAATLLTTTTHAATFLMSDVTNWIGPAAGLGISQGVLVIQWPSQPAWAWGFRWNSSVPRTGRDHLLGLAGADPRFTFTGGGFVSDLSWDADLNGTPEFTFPAFNPSTFEYLSYWVNNDQQAGVFDDGAAPTGAHILPPLGSPYDEAGPGRWVSSNTGVLGRPVVDGSWDGWNYSSGDGNVLPALAIDAPAPIPEPAAAGLLMLCSGLLLRRRRESAM